MSGKMKAAVLNKPLDIEVKERDVPTINENEVLVKVHCIGVCGSDVHYYEHGKIGRYVVKEPIILGHELAGDVVMIGASVSHLKVGDRVAIEPGVTCGTCQYCKSGRYNLCPDVVFMATPPVDGAWADYVKIRADFAFKLPDSMSFEEGALLEPLSVGFHSMIRGEVKPSDRLFISGLGPIGLLAVQAAKLFGVTEIYASDVVPFRRQLAEELGVTAVLNPLEGDVNQQLTDDLTSENGIDVVIETSGNASAVGDTVHVVKRGGRIVLVGMPVQDEIPLNVNQLIDAELNVHGVFRYVNTYPAAIQSLSNSDLSIEKIITHKYALKDIKKAVEMARTAKDTSIKIMIYPNEENV
ncbi:NAD(P)-dependent alcohol dehydrogenase [Halalkalibacter sp. APA_J-10(15)]|uniref:NAD(P)-dependent alcohol dehydrogenase n=1 Tax=Halalkalibacter sp. APA_J-10(15) TaxID=2933805 RepID=UPI001FF23CA2|nr:NAD(P)-dependent alcohol dehydrogenase [Halalkalibacter sp. APA_J-10(15)]MCK0469967.1 NAD(P)-dependent alcohol dehydrogenase [Halalkalibacter sp. APA_J-10(15)]